MPRLHAETWNMLSDTFPKKKYSTFSSNARLFIKAVVAVWPSF